VVLTIRLAFGVLRIRWFNWWFPLLARHSTGCG